MLLDKNPKIDSKNPPYVKGELLVIVDEKTNNNVTTSIPAGPARLSGMNLPQSFGVSTLDTFLTKHNCVGITKIQGVIPESRMNISSVAQKSSSELARTYRVRFDDPDMDTKKACTAMGKIKGVENVSLNYLNFAMDTIPNDTTYSSQWGLAKMNLPQAWDHTTGDSNIVVAVLDSGADLNHPDLLGNLVAGRDLVDLTSFGVNAGDIIDIGGEDWRIEGDVLTADNTPQDEVGHGTHVAGTIGAVSNNAQGVTGVAWECSLMPVRALFRVVRLSDNQVTGVGTDADIAAGLVWAANNGANIINMSIGGPDSVTKQNAINYAISQGCLCVAAMGNDNSSTPSYPAAYTGVLAVGAITSSESRAWFSNFGPHISVVAPGTNISSTYWDDTYDSLQGTSMACPHVAGLAVLILSCDNSLTADQVRAIIEETAKPLKDNPGDSVPNDNYGFGLVDAKAALDRVCKKATHPILDTITKFPEYSRTKPWLDVITTKPWIDDIITNPSRDYINKHPSFDIPETAPNIDWRKLPAYDKPPYSDARLPDRDIYRDPAPFIMATPHHYGGGSERQQDITEVFEQARLAYQRGELNNADIEKLDELYEQYSNS